MSKLTTLSKNCARPHLSYCDRCGFRLLSADVIPFPQRLWHQEKGFSPHSHHHRPLSEGFRGYRPRTVCIDRPTRVRER